MIESWMNSEGSTSIETHFLGRLFHKKQFENCLGQMYPIEIDLVLFGLLVVLHHSRRYFRYICDDTYMYRRPEEEG